MRESGAACGGELAGHYYFRDFYNCDSGELAALLILGEIAAARRSGQRCSSLIAPFRRYATTGELNFRIADKEAAMSRLHHIAATNDRLRKIYDFDGLRLEFDDWWFNVRPSNTEPYLRLVIEARDVATLRHWRDLLEAALHA